MAANVQDVIMLVGDSLTQGGFVPFGFAQQLAHVYMRKLDVINRGLSGYNTTWAIPAFEQFFARQHEQRHVPQVQLLTIWFGANDACIPPSIQHVPLPQFASNLSLIIQKVKNPSSPHYSPLTRIILFTPPPVNTHQRSADLATRTPPRALDRQFDVTRQYAEAVKIVGEKEKVPVLDVWTDVWEAAGKVEEQLSEFLYDGLHLNEKGYLIVHQGLLKLINEKYPEIAPDNLRFVFAGHAELDHSNLEQSLQKRSAFPN
ncbi:SGNH hydrolase-type esterase domain-containing protein [Abortiporus biennis]|nr:SGNH hydrolase-type esterase domain-containing protein [Abortiporus biennis]